MFQNNYFIVHILLSKIYVYCDFVQYKFSGLNDRALDIGHTARGFLENTFWGFEGSKIKYF